MSESSNVVRFGICGLGFMGRSYFSHLRRHARARITAVADHDAGRRAGQWRDVVGNLLAQGGDVVDMSGIRAYATAEELVRDLNVDVVAVTLPTHLHCEVTCLALAAGKHVICEKPMALTLEDCDRMLAAADAAGRTLMIAQCIRFWPQYERIRQEIARGAIGDVRFAFLRRIANPPGYSKDNWLLDAQRSGGAIFDLQVHDLDFALDLLGAPQSVYASGTQGVSGGIDHVLATLRYADGRYAILEGGWAFHRPWPFNMAITVHGDRGTLSWSRQEGSDVLYYTGAEQPERLACAEQPTAYQRELDYFIDCIQRGQPVDRCTPQSTRATIRCVEAELESIRRGQAVEFQAG